MRRAMPRATPGRITTHRSDVTAAMPHRCERLIDHPTLRVGRATSLLLGPLGSGHSIEPSATARAFPIRRARGNGGSSLRGFTAFAAPFTEAARPQRAALNAASH